MYSVRREHVFLFQSILFKYQSLCVCPAMRFVMLRGTELKLGMGVGDGPTRFVGIFSKRPHLGSKVIWGSICLKMPKWLPNLVRRTPDQSVVHCWGQKVMQGLSGVNQMSNCLEMPYSHQIWWEESLTREKCIDGVEGHVGVSWDQVGVNLPSNALRPPNLVGRTPDQSIMHPLGQRSCWGQLGSSRGHFA